jgi:hypothetical protein
VVEDFVKRFNENNASALAELYHEDAVNHHLSGAIHWVCADAASSLFETGE